MGSTPPGLIKLTRQLNALKNEVDENKKKIDDLEKENEELKDLTEKYKTGNSSILRKLDHFALKSKNNERNLDVIKMRLQECIEKRNFAFDRLSDAADNQVLEMSQINMEIQKTKEDFKSLHDQISEVSRNSGDSESTESLKGEVENLKSEIENLKKCKIDKEVLEMELQNARNDIKNILEHLAGVKRTPMKKDVPPTEDIDLRSPLAKRTPNYEKEGDDASVTSESYGSFYESIFQQDEEEVQFSSSTGERPRKRKLPLFSSISQFDNLAQRLPFPSLPKVQPSSINFDHEKPREDQQEGCQESTTPLSQKNFGRSAH